MPPEHPLDTFMRAWRGVFIVAFVLSGPIMLISYVQMFMDFVTSIDLWLAVVIVVSHLLGWIGIASLFDQQQERRNPPRDEQP